MPLMFFSRRTDCLKKKNTATTEMKTVPKRQILVISALLILAVLAVFWQAREFGFVQLDDNTYVTQNPHLRSGLTAEGIRWAFGTTSCEFWHPLTWLSFLLDFELFGLHPGGYHLTNVVWHLLATLLLFALFCRMTGCLWRSAFVAAFFALHPLHVESVAWVSERKDVLSAFFWMLTLYLYVYYTEKPALKRYLPVVFSFVCGLMSKPMVVTLPLVMILLDVWPLKRLNFDREGLLQQLKEKLPLLTLSAVFTAVTIYAQYRPAGRDLQFPLASRAANAFVSLVTYLQKTLWPTHLAAFYPFPDHIPALKAVAAVALILLITASAAAAAKRLPFLFVGWFWFLICISPVAGVVPIGDFAMADRFHYLPSIGLSVILAWGLPAIIKNDTLAKKFLLAAAGLFLLAMGIVSYQQTTVWKNSLALAEHTLNATRNNFMAHNGLGVALMREGKIQEAVAHFNQAIALAPHKSHLYSNRGIAHHQLGNHQSALEDFNRAISIDPRNESAYNNRGCLYNDLGQHQKAVDDLSAAIRLKPDYVEAYHNRAKAHDRLGRYQQAVDDYNRAMILNNNYLPEN